MDVVMKHQNTKDQPQNSLLGDEILHRCSTVFSLDLAEVKNTIDIEGWKLHKNSGQKYLFDLACVSNMNIHSSLDIAANNL